MSEQAREKSKRGPILTFLLAFIFFGYSLLGWGVFESRLTLTNFLVLFIIFFWNNKKCLSRKTQASQQSRSFFSFRVFKIQRIHNR